MSVKPQRIIKSTMVTGLRKNKNSQLLKHLYNLYVKPVFSYTITFSCIYKISCSLQTYYRTHMYIIFTSIHVSFILKTLKLSKEPNLYKVLNYIYKIKSPFLHGS